MKHAVSNIAWPVADDEAGYAMLEAAGVTHLEIAPPRWWPDLTQVTEVEARRATDQLLRRGFRICAFQALLFGKPALHVFGADDGRACLEYLEKICQLAAWMGAKSLVFGAPKNRLRGHLSTDDAFVKGRDFFRALGDVAVQNGVVVCIEPNPAIYGCDFLQTAAEATAMVQAVGSPGIRLNLDMGELIANNSDVTRTIRECLAHAGHFHASEPMLEPLDPAQKAHTEAAAALKEAGYTGFVSLEMKTPQGGLPVVARAVQSLMQIYRA